MALSSEADDRDESGLKRVVGKRKVEKLNGEADDRDESGLKRRREPPNPRAAQVRQTTAMKAD